MPKHDITRAFKEDDTEVYVKTHSDGVFIDEDELTTLTNYINDTKFESATGTTTNITVNMLDLYNGYSKSFIAYADNNGQATRINGKPLYKPNTTDAPNIIEGKAYTVWYDAIKNCFFLKASAEGNATAENVLADKKFSNDNDTGVTGTMPNRGAVNKTLALNETYTIPEGYHNGSGKVTQSITTREGYTDSVSNAIGEDILYTRIPQGAYFTNGGAGYPEIRTSVSSLASALQSASQSVKGNMIAELGGYKVIKGTYPDDISVYYQQKDWTVPDATKIYLWLHYDKLIRKFWAIGPFSEYGNHMDLSNIGFDDDNTYIDSHVIQLINDNTLRFYSQAEWKLNTSGNYYICVYR